MRYSNILKFKETTAIVIMMTVIINTVIMMTVIINTVILMTTTTS